MSKKAASLMAALDTLPERPKAAAPQPDARAPNTQGREGKANVSAYLDAQFQRNLRQAKATFDISAQDAIADALNDWCKKMGLPVVVGVPSFDREGRRHD